MGFDLFPFLAGLDTREAIVLAAVAVLALLLVERLIRILLRRRRSDRSPTWKQRRRERTEIRRTRRAHRKSKRSPASEPESSWLEERIGPVTAQKHRGPVTAQEHLRNEEEPDDAPDTPPSPPVKDPEIPVPSVPPHGAHVAPNEQVSGPEPTPRTPPNSTPISPASASEDTTQMAEALRVIQRLHDEGSLAPDWSIMDATLIYWAMISPQVHDALDSVGMTDEEYLTAMRRMLAHGLIDQGNHPRGISDR